jgi:isopentenyl phosphate kinase
VHASAPPVIVKLGGSVVTRKREDSRLRPKVLQRLAEELATPGGPPTVVLHGAGSFGHPGARRWRLAEAPGTQAGAASRRLRGAAIVSARVRRLHGAVLQALLDAGANPWSVPPASVAWNRAGTITELDAGPFRAALDRSAIPVAFGDVVPDRVWGFSILSADTIAVELSRRLAARRVLFVSDVDGILEAAPAAHGRRAPRVMPLVTTDLVADLGPAGGGADVTGGIRAKARAMLAIAETGADAGLISGLRHGALSRALRGERVYGSWTQSPGS